MQNAERMIGIIIIITHIGMDTINIDIVIYVIWYHVIYNDILMMIYTPPTLY